MNDWWRALSSGSGGPLYLQIADAIEAAVAGGALRPGDRLPPQRSLARDIGVDLTTVTRAYSEARRRNLLDAVTGRGSYVAAAPQSLGPALDLSMNLPPSPRGVSLARAISHGLQDILARFDVDVLMSYHSGPGSVPDRAAAAAWLARGLGPVDPDRVVIAAGAQAALAAILALRARRGEALLVERSCYPGVLLAATQGGLRCVAVEGDAEGATPDAIERAARDEGARLLYLNPTICNPTTLTMPEARRREVAAVAERAGLEIVEDDPYSPLADAAPPAFATIAPALTWHVATLSKCLTPGLRTAYLVAPGREAALDSARALRAVTLMPAPLMTALATFWIRDGVAGDLLAGVRTEATERQSLARELLPEARGHPNGLHLWLELPAAWDRFRLVEAARAHGLGVTPSDAFQVEGDAPEAVRISLGAIAERARLATALRTLAGIVRAAPQAVREVV